jgi:UDPglucose 6-dehydrogenase
LVLVTEWQQFAHLDLGRLAKCMTRAILVDGRNLFDPEAARQAGFDYCGIGRPQRTSWNDSAVAASHAA